MTRVTSDELLRLERLRTPGLRLSPAAKRAVLLGSAETWRGSKENGTDGSTMRALERRGLVTAAWSKRPHRRMMYRLTTAGQALRSRWIMEDEERSRVSGFLPPNSLDAVAANQMLDVLHPEHVPIAVKCEHCGWEFDDGTDGGGCGRCGMTVRAVDR